MKFDFKNYGFILSVSLLFFIFIILLNSLVLVYDLGFYNKEALKYGVYDGFGNKSNVNYENLLSYFKGDTKLIKSYTIDEVNHLNDVKDLINIIELITWVLGLILLILFLILFYKKYKYTWKIFVCSSILILIGIVLFYLCNLINFDWLFNYFHKVLFTNGSWIFDDSSVLIRMFPEGLFIDALERILFCSFVSGLVVFLIGICLRKRFKWK